MLKLFVISIKVLKLTCRYIKRILKNRLITKIMCDLNEIRAANFSMDNGT